MQSKRTPASRIALGGVLAALAVVIMSMGTLIPVATYVCPMICCVILELVRKITGNRIARQDHIPADLSFGNTDMVLLSGTFGIINHN